MAEGCPRSQDSLCSFELQASALGLAYWTCPRELEICGSRETITVSGTAETPNRLQLGDWVASGLQSGSVCRFRLTFPFEARDYDEIKISTVRLRNAIAYVTETASFTGLNPRQDVLLKMGDSFSATYPKLIYLTIVADKSGLKTEYDFSLSFTDNDGEAIAKRLQEQQAAQQQQSDKGGTDANVVNVVTRYEYVEQGPNSPKGDEDSMTVLIVAGSIVAFIIGGMVVTLIVLRRKQLQEDEKYLKNGPESNGPKTP